MSSKLVLLQTTNLIFNLDLYALVKPQSLFAWQRVRVANMMANSGQEWYQTFRMYNSGTSYLISHDLADSSFICAFTFQGFQIIGPHCDLQSEVWTNRKVDASTSSAVSE